MSTPPFRAEHIGSLLRPKDLVEGAEDEAIARVIRWQESLGLKARADAISEVDLQRDDAGNVARIGSAPLAVAKLRRTGPIAADEVAFALKHATRTVKATLPAPSYLHYPRGKVYTDEIAALGAVGGGICRSTRWRNRCSATRICAPRCARGPRA